VTSNLAFINGILLTPDAGASPAQALAVRDGRIVAIGADKEIRRHVSADTEIVDLAGRTLMPGFIDAHTHLIGIGVQRRLHVDLGGARSVKDVLATVAQAAGEKENGQWILGGGWDESVWKRAVFPTRTELDRATPDHPVALMRVDGHMMCVNSRAMEAVALPDDARLVDRANGWVREAAVEVIENAVRPDREAMRKALEAEIAHVNSLGITCVHETCGLEMWDLFASLRSEKRLRVRINIFSEDLDGLDDARTGPPNEWLSIGALKLIADGSIGARTAALSAPYADAPGGSGMLNFSQKELTRRVRKGRERGLQVMIHAIGDRAIDVALDAFEAAGVTPADRARIEHLELPAQAHLARMRERGVIASMQPNFTQWSGPGRMYATRLGEDRDSLIDPHRRVLDADVALAFGSDWMPPGPLYGMDAAVNAPHPAQRVSAAEALRAYTAGGAYAGFAESIMGALCAGNLADLVVLDGNPLTEAGRLNRLKVEQVYIGGRKVA
jgi:predicted amidohydrolase YtcJ